MCDNWLQFVAEQCQQLLITRILIEITVLFNLKSWFAVRQYQVHLHRSDTG